MLACAWRVQQRDHVHTSALTYSQRFDDTHPLDRLCQEDPERSYGTGGEEVLNRPRERLRKLDCTEQSEVSPKQAFQFCEVEDATRVTHSTLKRVEPSLCHLHILSFELCRFFLKRQMSLKFAGSNSIRPRRRKGKLLVEGKKKRIFRSLKM